MQVGDIRVGSRPDVTLEPSAAPSGRGFFCSPQPASPARLRSRARSDRSAAFITPLLTGCRIDGDRIGEPPLDLRSAIPHRSRSPRTERDRRRASAGGSPACERMRLDREQLRRLLSREQRVIEHRGSSLSDHVVLAFLGDYRYLNISIPNDTLLSRRDTITTSALSMMSIARRHTLRDRRDTRRLRQRDRSRGSCASRIEARDYGRPRPRASAIAGRGARPAPRVSSLISALAESATTCIYVNRAFSRLLCGCHEFSGGRAGRPIHPIRGRPLPSGTKGRERRARNRHEGDVKSAARCRSRPGAGGKTSYRRASLA